MSLVACNQDLLDDVEPQDRIAESAVWSDAKLIEAYHAELYNGIPHGFYIHMLSKYTDEAFNAAPCCGADLFRLNTFSPDNISQAGGDNAGFWAANNGYLYFWDHGYEYVRKINVFLEKMEETEVVLENKERMIAEARFIRAFIYFKLATTFGGVPIITDVYHLGDNVQLTRNSFDEVVEFIEDELDDAMPDLEQSYPASSPNYGRATRDAAQALLSRLFLYAASPLHNPTNDLTKWQKAADETEPLLTAGYSLYPDYQQLFLLSQKDPQNEIIFSRGFTTSNGHQAPMNNFNRRYEGYGGWWGSNGPSGNLIDAYEMTNGEPPFLADGTINPASGYDPQDPWANRDPRFEATIVHDGTVFRGDLFEMWISEDEQTRGYDSYKNTGDNPRTNTVLKKFMPTEGPFNWSVQFTSQWPHFRLAEIYLNYAEAMFELGDEATARQYLNLVRSRTSVSMPDIPATVTGNDLRERIRNERRIELAFEGHRFFDVRRWMIGSITENGPIYTYDVFLETDQSSPNFGQKRYEKVTLLDKTGTWEERMNLLPIAEDEIRRSNIDQTPGWESN